MSAQYYVSPEQLMKDRADFARKGIARGRAVIVASCAEGIALIAENPSGSLHKIGEIYDRIAFAAVGKYNEFESLRQAGVRYADTRGYSYARQDVTGRGLASVYAQSLGAVFTAEAKPFEVELAVLELGETQEEDTLFSLNFDGSIAEQPGLIIMGGDTPALAGRVGRRLGRARPGRVECRRRDPCRRRRPARRRRGPGRRRASWRSRCLSASTPGAPTGISAGSTSQPLQRY